MYYDEIAVSLSELQRHISSFARSLDPEHVAALRLNPAPATPILNGMPFDESFQSIFIWSFIPAIIQSNIWSFI